MIGIDVIGIDRIKFSYDRFGERFLSRFLSSSESLLCFNSDNLPNYQRIAGFWTAKEAIAKALGTGIGAELAFWDIVLSKDHKGRPQATLTKEKIHIFNLKQIALSITHDQNLAIAVAWIEQN